MLLSAFKQHLSLFMFLFFVDNLVRDNIFSTTMFHAYAILIAIASASMCAGEIVRDVCPPDCPSVLCSDDFTVVEVGYQFAAVQLNGTDGHTFYMATDRGSYLYLDTYPNNRVVRIVGRVFGLCTTITDDPNGEWYCNEELHFTHNERLLGTLSVSGVYPPENGTLFSLSITGGTGVHAARIGVIHGTQLSPIDWKYRVQLK